MNFVPFSKKQLAVLTWWYPGSPMESRDALICDGAVRSGKTLCMAISFVFWAFFRFRGQSFAFCGKTIASLRRNVVSPLLSVLPLMGMQGQCRISQNRLEIRSGRQLWRTRSPFAGYSSGVLCNDLFVWADQKGMLRGCDSQNGGALKRSFVNGGEVAADITAQGDCLYVGALDPAASGTPGLTAWQVE